MHTPASTCLQSETAQVKIFSVRSRSRVLGHTTSFHFYVLALPAIVHVQPDDAPHCAPIPQRTLRKNGEAKYPGLPAAQIKPKNNNNNRDSVCFSQIPLPHMQQFRVRVFFSSLLCSKDKCARTHSISMLSNSSIAVKMPMS